MFINRFQFTKILQLKTLLLLTLTLNGCWSTYVQPDKPDNAKIKIINDSEEMTIVLSTFKDGATCTGTQYFSIPKEMQTPNANMDSHLKVRGQFETSIDSGKPFSLAFHGIKGNPALVVYCDIKSTLQTITKNASYEYHYNYSAATRKCSVYLLELTSDNNKSFVESPRFVSRESRAGVLHADSECE